MLLLLLSGHSADSEPVTSSSVHADPVTRDVAIRQHNNVKPQTHTRTFSLIDGLSVSSSVHSLENRVNLLILDLKFAPI